MFLNAPVWPMPVEETLLSGFTNEQMLKASPGH